MLRNKDKIPIKLLIAMQGNYGYLAGWTYPLKIYRKRFQFASKSTIYNDASPLCCEGHLKGQWLPPRPQPAPLQDASSRLPHEQSLQQPLELVGRGREALQQQQQQQQLRLQLREKVN
jgi:hypothetical protein